MSRAQAGPPERLPGSRVRGVLRSRADELVRQRARVRKSAGVEAIHDLRVAARRLQVALSFLEAWLEPEARRRLHRRTRRIRRSLGAVRNTDVMVRLVRDLSRRLPAAERGNLRELAQRLRAESSALRRARVPVAGVRKRIARLLDRVEAPASFSLQARVREVLTERRKEISKALDAARTGRSAPLHRLRIGVKRCRYSLEILEEVGWHHAGEAIRAARELQRELGRVHDLDVLIHLIQETAGGGAGSLLPRIRGERRRRLAAARKAMARFRLPGRLLRSSP